ncbi:MAG: dihydrofolate reductase [Lachnospiraceae bacterium]|nr:dihydrofolate reductase [Lachnospiraceae bacterium]
MNLIAAVDRNWAIGFKNQLLAHIPEDQRFFRSMTEGKVVVMGRKTLESLPGGRPLKNRVNIVLSRNKDFQAEGCTVCHSVEELMSELEKYPSQEIFVIGGEKIYTELVDMCDRAYITSIDREYEADAFFPDLDRKDEWEMVHSEDDEEHTYFDLIYYFREYVKKVPQSV